MTYTEQTDGIHYFDGYLWIRSQLIERGLRAGIFASLDDLRSDYIYDIKKDVDNGLIGVDVYSSLLPSFMDKLLKRRRRITESEWKEFYDWLLMPAYFRVFGKIPKAVSYAYGNDMFKGGAHQFLGGRNSRINGCYNYEKKSIVLSRPSTTRWYDEFVGGGIVLKIK